MCHSLFWDYLLEGMKGLLRKTRLQESTSLVEWQEMKATSTTKEHVQREQGIAKF